MKAADLFAGAGGFSTGARLAGVPVVWAANHWPAALRFLASLARYEFRECVQHSQAVAMGGGL